MIDQPLRLQRIAPRADAFPKRFDLISLGLTHIMTKKHADLTPTPAPSSALADGFVLVAMALVAAAITVGLHLQMGLPLLGAAIVGGALFAGLAGFHAMGRGVETEQVLNSKVEHLQAELDRIKSSPQIPSRAQANRGAFKPGVEKPEMAPMVRAETPAGSLRPAASPTAAPTATSPPPMMFDELFNAPMPAPATPAKPAATAKSDPFTFRPSEPVLKRAAAIAPPPLTAPGVPAQTTAAPMAPSSPREDDVEMIQNLIKKMAAQVNAAELARETADVPTQPAHAGVDAGQPIRDAGLEASLDALRTTASTMRNASAHDPALAPIAAEPAPIAAAPFNAEAVMLAQAIEAGRVDVLLEPILGLGDKAARHYEVAIRVRGDLGEDLGHGDNATELRGRGLLPLFDRARISRTSIIAERMADRGKIGSVFSRTTGESLSDGTFATSLQADFIDRPALARYMVLTFTQADVRAFSVADQNAVAALSQLGFRFAITSVTDLDMNFEAMARAGFGFVKLDADVFLKGLPIPGGTIPAADVCRHLAGTGFAVIVQQIDDEAKLASVAGFGAALGQGPLFGGPRPVKADVVARAGQAAA